MTGAAIASATRASVASRGEAASTLRTTSATRGCGLSKRAAATAGGATTSGVGSATS